MDHTMFENLLAHIKRYISLSDEEEKKLLPYLTYKELKKKEHVLKEGKVCTANHFIIKGCLRMYSLTENGTEQIVQFGIENWWITDYMSLDTQKPGQFSIQAIEPSAIVILHKNTQDELFRKIPKLERYFRLVLQRAYAASVMRVKYIFTESGEERFRQFTNSFPEFVQRVPQYMLASYLGFTPEFLSKIRAKKN
ncbi:MAG: Crp/Fnr family transcriptional regulator [Bacteroidota bacterium]|nr:Crp/Fnr family transcriptional regulator [Bacteroidota bacterium]